MSNAIVDSIFIRLGLDTKGVEEGMRNAEGRIKGGLRSIVSAMSGPITAAFGALSAGAAINAYTTTASQLDALSKSLNMSMEDLQGWQYAAENAGAEAEEVGNFFRDMSDYIVDATTFDSGPLKDIAEQLKISLKDAKGGLKSTAEVALEVADAFSQIDPQKAVAFGMQMSLDPGMIQLLQKGRKEIEGLIQAQKDLGGYTKEDAEIANKAKLAFSTLGKAFQSVAMGIARVLVPIMQKAAEGLSKIVVFLREHSPFVKAVFTGIAAVITAMLIPAIFKLKAAMIALAANPLVIMFTALGAILVGIGLLVDDFYAYMQGGKSVFADLWSVFGTGEEISRNLAAAWDTLKAAGRGLFTLLSAAGKNLLKNFSGVFYGLKDLNKGLVQLFKGIAQLDFSQIWKGVYSIAKGLNGVLLGAANGIVGVVKDLFSKIAEKVGPPLKKAVNDALDSVQGFFEDAFNAVADFIGSTFDRIATTITGIFQGVIDWIANGFKALVSSIGDWFKGMFDKLPGVDWIKDKLGFGKKEEGTPYKPEGDWQVPAPLSADRTLRPRAADAGALTGRMASAHAAKTDIKNTSTVNTGPITIQANPANAQGIADGLGGKLSSYQWNAIPYSAQTGVVQK